MEEIKTFENEFSDNEELFEYIDQCRININVNNTDVNEPLDVLLILIKQAKIDIEDLFISKVTEQFLGYVYHLQNKNIEEIGSYLVVASKILEIKAKAMLPIILEEDFVEGEDDYFDEESDFINTLKEYQKKIFQDASEKLKEQEQTDRFYKEPDESTKETKVVFSDFNLNELVKAFSDVMLKYNLGETARKTVKEIPTEAYSEDKKIRYVSSFLKEKGSCSFYELFTQDTNKLELITTFKVILELIKLQCISVEQKTIYDDITLTFKREWSEEDGAIEE